MRPFQLQKTVEPKKQASLPQAKVESDTAAEVKPEDRSKYGHDEDDESASMPEAVVETAREDDANNEDGKPHASEASGNFVPPPLPAAYAMPYGYMPPHISPYGHPAMPYGMPGPYGPNPHPAILNSYMGYPPGFIWSDAYGNPMYTGMAPGMTGPPPRPSIPDPPPTPTRSGGPAPQSRKKSTEPCKDDDEEEEGKGSPK